MRYWLSLILAALIGTLFCGYIVTMNKKPEGYISPEQYEDRIGWIKWFGERVFWK